MTKRAAHPPITALLITLALIVSMVSCAPPAERDRLRRAEALMESDAKAASAALDSIRPTALRGEARARYALLRTQADYKNYVPLTTDSLALIATEYYGLPHNKDYHAAMAWYCLGTCYSDMSDDPAAIRAYLNAKDCFPDTTVKYYALCNQNMGTHYMNKGMWNEAIGALSALAESDYCQLNPSLKSLSLYRIGLCQLYQMEFDKAESSFLALMADENLSPYQQNELYFELAKIESIYKKNYPRANQLLETYKKHITDESKLGAYYVYKAVISNNNNLPDSAYYFYQQSLTCQEELNTLCSSYRELIKLAPIVQQTDSLHIYVNRYETLLDSIYESHRREEISRIENDHTVALHDRELATRHQSFVLYTIIGLLFITVLLFSFYSAKDRKRQQVIRELEARLREANTRQVEASIPDETTNDGSLTRDRLIELYRQKLTTASALFQTKRSRNLLDEVKFKDRELDEKERSIIQDDFYACFIDVIRDLCAECPKINKQEVYLCICSCLGYPTKVVATFLLRGENTVRSQKTRLRAKMPEEIYQLFFTD